MVHDPSPLYAYADKHGIEVDWIDLAHAPSLSITLPDGTCCIAVNPWKMDTIEKEIVSMAHELGHCRTGSFYNRYALLDLVQRHENRADKWAVKHLVPVDQLDEAVADGCTELWQLADHFHVTEDFMRKAVCWHIHSNLAAELYF